MSVPYIGSKISLMSKALIRYEGILYNVNREDSTITLSQVQSLGTEGRSTDHQIPARDEIFEYIIFKADDIAELTVCETPSKTQLQDPAILSMKAGSGAPAPNKAPAPIGSRTMPQKTSPKQTAPPTTYRAAAAMNIPPQPLISQQQPYNAPRSGNSNRSAMPMQAAPYSGRGWGQPRANYNDRFNNRQDGFNNQRNSAARGHGAGSKSFDSSYRGNEYHRGRGRGGNRGPPGAPKQTEKLRFDSDFDINEANEMFAIVLQELKLNDMENENNEAHDDADDEVEELNCGGGDDNSSQKSTNNCYNKQRSFFDTISCDALERKEGTDSRQNWKHERKVNTETFGQPAVRQHYRGRFRGRGRSYSNYRGGGFGMSRRPMFNDQ